MKKAFLIFLMNFMFSTLVLTNTAWSGNWNQGGSSSKVETQTLICKFNKYGSSGYDVSVAESWIWKNQTHIFSGMSATYPDRKDWGRAKITTNNSNKLAWEYKLLSTDEKGAKSESRFKYIFFRSNNKIAASVDFVGYRGIGNVWGTCEAKSGSGTSGDYIKYSDATEEQVCNEVSVGFGDYTANIQIKNADGTVKNQGWIDEAKRRWGGDYGTKCNNILSVSQGSSSSSSSTSSSSKIDKAKSTCTDLGFTAGTEKHGECVLKVMDN